MTNCHKLRVVFAGTPEFALPALQSLIDSTHEVIAVFTQPDRPAGRGRKLQPSVVKQCATAQDIPVHQPASFREPSALELLVSLQPDIMVVVAYGLLLPPDVLAAPTLGCINIHGSLLPRWRGAAPVQRAILAGDSHTGVTLMQMDAGLDTGPMLLHESVDILSTTTTATLQPELAQLGADLLAGVLSGWCDGSIKGRAQNNEHATYAAKLDKAEALLDWSQPALAIHRRICAFNPVPVCETTLDGARLRIWQSSPGEGDAGSNLPGCVLRCDKNGFEVATGQGTIRVLQLQLPGKKPIGYKDFANGRDVTGRVLGCSPEQDN